MDALLGLDVGTTSTKAVLFDAEGRELSRAASEPYSNQSPQPGWVEQDPEGLWQAVLSAVKAAVSNVGPDVLVRALAMAVQSGSLIPADENGDPVYPMITWMDGRTEGMVRRWKEEGLQEKVRPISGWSLYPGLPLPAIAWLRENDSSTFSAARHYFSVNDFLVYRLTGLRVSNPSNAGGMQLVDIHRGDWHPDLCELAGIEPEQLSEIQPSGSVIGPLKPDVARDTGLPEDVVLVNGGHDQVVTALGMGILDPGKLLLACGTAWVFTGISSTPDRSFIPETLDLNFHARPERWTISQSLGGLGASLEWLVSQAWHGDRAGRYAALDLELEKAPPNDRLFFAPLTGGHDDPATTRPGGFLGLQLHHTRASMARAVMESAGYELAWALEALREAGMPLESLWMVGGAASSPHWPGILANITDLPIHLPEYSSWPALGAAVLAGTGIGTFGSVPEALERFRMPVQVVKPQGELVDFYREKTPAYRKSRWVGEVK